MSEDYAGRQIVGMDLHRRRSVLVRMTEAGEALETVRIVNDRDRLAAVMARAGEAPEVVLEATYGWYWAADTLAELGASVHLAHPLGVKAFAYRRVKNDERDARDLAAMLRLGRLSEGWIAPPPVRELRELVRYRYRLVGHRTSCKAQIHGVMAKNGILPARVAMWGPGGQAQLDSLELGGAYELRLESLRDLIDYYDREIGMVERRIHLQLKDDAGYQAIQRIDGVGRVLGAVFVAEVGDVSRFASAGQLCSWAGLTPRHRESDARVSVAPSPSKAHRWCAGPPSRPSPSTGAGPSCAPTTTASPPVAASSRPGWRSPASC